MRAKGRALTHSDRSSKDTHKRTHVPHSPHPTSSWLLVILAMRSAMRMLAAAAVSLAVWKAGRMKTELRLLLLLPMALLLLPVSAPAVVLAGGPHASMYCLRRTG